MNWRLWLEGLAFAAIGGAVTGATHAVTNGGQINETTGIAAALGALFGVAAYLKPPATVQATQDSPALGPGAPIGLQTNAGFEAPPVRVVPSGPKPPR